MYKTYVEAVHFTQTGQDQRVDAGPGDGTKIHLENNLGKGAGKLRLQY